MNDERKSETAAEQTQNPTSETTEKRRNLLKAGLAAAPVLMSLPSRSAIAGATTRPSGFCSLKNAQALNISTSSPGSQKKSCSGWTPTQWCNQVTATNPVQHGWPSNCYPKTYTTPYSVTATKCGEFFPSVAGALSPHTCYNIMRGEPQAAQAGASDFDRWCIAAVLNARAGRTANVCMEDDVKRMYNDCKTYGYYSPTSGVKWYPADVIAYLQTTCG